MFSADAHRFAWLNGTNFGRAVVPEVCRSNAVAAGPSAMSIPGSMSPSPRLSITTIPKASATRRAPLLLASVTRAFARRSVK
jgi:hypothetical protein